MSRRRSERVDYFPHVVRHGRTMKVIETRFGDAGYAFWFRLLEMLGDTDGHCFRVGNPADMAFLESLSLSDGVSVTEMLDVLAMLGAIDAELWAEKTIWSQNFVDHLEPLYNKRATGTPQRPDIRGGNPTVMVYPGRKPHSDGISGESTPKEKDRIGKDIEEREKETFALWKSEPALCQTAWKTFEKYYGTFIPNHTKEIDAINKLIAMSAKRGKVEVILPAMMKKLQEMKEDDNSKNGFWKKKPFLPSRLVSHWSLVWEEAKVEHQADSEVEELFADEQ